jgi:hypothetical protein
MPSANTCMGIFRFEEDKKRIFHSIIKPLVESHTGLKYEDATFYYEPSVVKMDLISKMIRDARLVIVELSEENANVFLELGVAYELGKPMVLLCSRTSWKTKWKKKAPFDLGGREILIFEDDDDLKVKLGRHISDSLYPTKEVTVSWVSHNPKNHMTSPSEIEIFEKGEIWSNIGVNSNFVISYHIKVLEHTNKRKNPDLRLFFAGETFGYPRVANICPWEKSTIDPDKYECHIGYHYKSEKQKLNRPRLQAVSVGKRNKTALNEIRVFVSFCWPNLVFESSFFEEKDRLIVSKDDFRSRGFPTHLSLYIGFEARHCHVTIDDIRIKEVFL